MTDVPPKAVPDGEGASGTGSGVPSYPPPPPPGPPPAFDDDALAAALEADIATYTQPIPAIPPLVPGPPPAAAAAPPAAPPAAVPSAAVPTPEPVAPAPVFPAPVAEPAAPDPYEPYVEPEQEYLTPDVPEYVVPPAPPTPEYVVPSAPPTPAYEPPAAPGEGQPYDLSVDPEVSASSPTTLDAIGRLEEELRRRDLGLPPLEEPTPPATAPPAPPAPAAPEPIAPAPAAPTPEWQAAPAPSWEPPPLVEPPIESAPLPPVVQPPEPREFRLEDVQGLPPPIGMQAAAIPPFDANAPLAPPQSPADFGGQYAAPVSDTGFPPPPFEENDDSVDQIDRVFGADALLGAASQDDLFAPPSQPIPTQRIREGDPALVGAKPENHPVFLIETAGTDPTALDLRAGRAGRLFWLWFAANSSIVSLGLGAVLFTLGMSLRQAIVATLAGVALSFLPLGLGTLAGKWSGQPMMVVSRATFGHLGNVLPAIVAVLVRVFWGGALLWLLAISSASLLVFAGLDADLGESVWTFVILGIGFVVALLIAVFGYGFVALLQLVASILSGLLIAGLIVMTFPRLNIEAALATPDGAWSLVIGGTVIVFSFVGLAWVQASSDLARYQRPASSGAATVLWATVGATLPPFILITWGAMLAASDPTVATGLVSAPLETVARMLPLWYPAPLLAAAGLGLLSGIVLTMYSGGFALQALGLRMPRFAASIVAALVVGAVAVGLVILSADVTLIVRDLATTLAVPVAAWAGIFAAEMMIRTRQFDNASLLAPGGVYPKVRTVNFVAFLLLTAVGFGLSSATFPGLTWQGFLWPLLGVAAEDPLATSDVGVLVALVLGAIVPLATAIPAIKRQEMDSLRATPTGSIPRITGSIPRVTGAVPQVTDSTPDVTIAPPRLEP